MKNNEALLKEYYSGITVIDPTIYESYVDMLHKAIFVINTKLNNGDNSIIKDLHFVIGSPDRGNGVYITADSNHIEKEKIVDAISMFLRQNTGVETITVSINKEDKKTVIVTPDYNMRDFWKSLCGLLPMLVPWCLSFEGKNAIDVDFVKQYLSNSFENSRASEEKAEQMFVELFEKSNIKTEFMKKQLEEFSKSFLRMEQQRLNDNIRSLKDDQNHLIERFEDVTTRLQDYKIKLAGLEANDEHYKAIIEDIVFIVDTTDGLSIVDIEGDSLYFDYVTPMEIWQRDEFETFIANPRSYLYTRVTDSINVKPSTIEKFWKRIFDTCEYKVMFITMFELDFMNAQLKNRARDNGEHFRDIARARQCMFNPHISTSMTCMEEYRMQVAQCMNEGLYSDAVGSMCMAAKSFSISDITIGNTFVKGCLELTCIKTPDGVFRGIDILQKIDEEDE